MLKSKKIKPVVDTNIVFSTLLNSNSRVSEIIMNYDDVFEFYSCAYMKLEIRKHWKKLLKISKLSTTELEQAKELVFDRLYFIDEALIPPSIWKKANRIVSSIIEDDIDFITLSFFLKCKLWTGDKQLIMGLLKLKQENILTTSEVEALIITNT